MVNQALENYRKLPRDKQIEVEEKGLCSDPRLYLQKDRLTRIKVQGFGRLMHQAYPTIQELYRHTSKNHRIINNIMKKDEKWSAIWACMEEREQLKVIWFAINF